MIGTDVITCCGYLGRRGSSKRTLRWRDEEFGKGNKFRANTKGRGSLSRLKLPVRSKYGVEKLDHNRSPKVKLVRWQSYASNMYKKNVEIPNLNYEAPTRSFDFFNLWSRHSR